MWSTWKEAAEIHESVTSDALVMPRRLSGCAGCRVHLFHQALVLRLEGCATCSKLEQVVSSHPRTFTAARRSIYRTMVSTCLSLIFTPWSR